MEDGGPADRGRIEAGDVLIGLGDAPVAGADDLIRLLGAEAIGRSLEAKVIRADRIERRLVVPQERR